MDIGYMLVFLFFFIIDFILIYRPVPILAFPVMVFFIYVGVTVFFELPNTVLPMNPLLTAFFLIFCSIGILVNALDVRR